MVFLLWDFGRSERLHRLAESKLRPSCWQENRRNGEMSHRNGTSAADRCEPVHWLHALH
jgi:hypothetical protein